jgi:hypothetical protein
MKFPFGLFPETRPPHISLESFCPACGNPGCKLKYDPATKKVNRTCDTCGCVVQQDPIAPDLFKK